MENRPNILFEQNRDKTRVLITGASVGIADMVIKILGLCGKHVDYSTSTQNDSSGNDFFVLESTISSGATEFYPNVVFIASRVSNEDFSGLLRNIVGGGILIYNEDDANLANAVDKSENYFRKITYSVPDTDGHNYKTDYGNIPLPNLNTEITDHIEGVKQLCLQLGIREEEFYESLINF